MSEREIFRSFLIYGGINEVSNSRKAKCSSYNCKSNPRKNKKNRILRGRCTTRDCPPIYLFFFYSCNKKRPAKKPSPVQNYVKKLIPFNGKFFHRFWEINYGGFKLLHSAFKPYQKICRQSYWKANVGNIL